MDFTVILHRFVDQKRFGALFSFVFSSAFIFRAQKNPTSSIETFLSPLKFDVWLCVVCLTIAIVLMMALMLKVERKLTKNKSLSWSYLLVLILGVFCQQGSRD